jgi:regulator-associated protein of mTOR
LGNRFGIIWYAFILFKVGIFPYILKLLQSPSNELSKILVLIWAKIISYDKSCQKDLIKESAHIYFINILKNKENDYTIRTLACFILCSILDDHTAGQEACIQTTGIFSIISEQLSSDDPFLKRWLCFFISKLIEGLIINKKRF